MCIFWWSHSNSVLCRTWSGGPRSSIVGFCHCRRGYDEEFCKSFERHFQIVRSSVFPYFSSIFGIVTQYGRFVFLWLLSCLSHRIEARLQRISAIILLFSMRVLTFKHYHLLIFLSDTSSSHFSSSWLLFRLFSLLHRLIASQSHTSSSAWLLWCFWTLECFTISFDVLLRPIRQVVRWRAVCTYVGSRRNRFDLKYMSW